MCTNYILHISNLIQRFKFLFSKYDKTTTTKVKTTEMVSKESSIMKLFRWLKLQQFYGVEKISG